MMRIVVTGSECTGKSTLAAELAGYYGVPFVPEFARSFVAARDAPVAATDVEAIAHGQMALEDAVAAGNPMLLILDTDLLSTVLYARHYFGSCPGWIVRAARQRRGDLYLLAGIDVPWMPDGHQRDRPHGRDDMQEMFRDGLVAHDARHVELRGPPDDRLAAAVAAIEQLRHDGAIR